MPTRVLLAHPRGAENRARGVAAELRALGYEVRECASRAQRLKAHKVVVLWSREARGTPALRAVARKAHAAGKLVCVQTDSAPPPVHGAPGVRMMKSMAWRRLLSAKTRPARLISRPARRSPSTARAKLAARPAETVGTDMRLYSESSSRTFAIVLALLLVGAVGLGVAYKRYPQVAAPIDGAAAAIYAQASEIAALAP